jgi:WD40 repeat protein
MPGVSEGRRPLEFLWHAKLEDYVTAAAWAPDGALLAAASVSGQLGIYDAAAGRARHLLEKAHADGGDAVAWRPDGAALATAGRDGRWRLWDVADGAQLAEQAAGAPWPEHLAWSPVALGDGGHRLALGAGNRVSLWTESGEACGEAMVFPRTVAQVAWVRNGGTLAVATSAGVSLRDPLSGAEVKAYPAREAVLNMAFSPAGKWLMTGNQDCSVHVWNVENGVEAHMRGYAAKVRQLAWHRGGRWLAAGGGAVVSVWDCAGAGPQGRTPALLEFHTDLVSALAYQPQGDWLASGSRDGGVAVWSPTQRQSLVTAGRIGSGVTRVAWSPDGKQLAVTGEMGEVQVVGVG